MNTTQCQNFIFKLKDIMSIQQTGIVGLTPLYISKNHKFKNIQYKQWKIRYYPGRVFVFNGEQKIKHEIWCHTFNGEIFGLRYMVKKHNCIIDIFFKSKSEIVQEIGKHYYIYSRISDLSIFLPTCGEYEKDITFALITRDIEKTLHIKTEDDFNKFMNAINLIGVQSI